MVPETPVNYAEAVVAQHPDIGIMIDRLCSELALCTIGDRLLVNPNPFLQTFNNRMQQVVSDIQQRAGDNEGNVVTCRYVHLQDGM